MQAGSGPSAFAAEGDALLDALLSEAGDAPGMSGGGGGGGEAVFGAAEGSGGNAPGPPEVNISSELRKVDCHVLCHADQLLIDYAICVSWMECLIVWLSM